MQRGRSHPSPRDDRIDTMMYQKIQGDLLVCLS